MRALPYRIPSGCYETPACAVVNMAVESTLLLQTSTGAQNEDFNNQTDYGDNWE